MEDFARAVEDGLKMSKRLVLPGGLPPPRPPAGMERGPDALLLPAAPMAYAVVADPGAVDTPDVPSYQPYVYGRLDPPALIPLQMKEVDLAADCAIGVAAVTLRARWWLHCITRSRDCDVRIIVPMGEQVFKKAVVFVVDTSGSMQGKPLENVKNAVSTALSELAQGDYFNIVTFNDELHSFSSCLEKVNEKTIAGAIDWMNQNFVAEGGTDIMHPLSEAMALLSSAHDVLPQIFLITDGSVDDEHDICKTVQTELISRGSKSPRISTFGLGVYCNHYFLRMLASIGKGHYDAALETGSVESRILKWFKKASNTAVANISIDATKYLDDFEVDSEYIPDISAESPLCVSGKYRGKFPDTVIAKGNLADMTEISIELKVQHVTDMPLDNFLAAQQIALLTAKAWLSADKQLERKVMRLSIQHSVISEYTSMVALQTNLDAPQKVKQKQKGANEPLRIPLHGLKLGFGDKAATRENLLAGFGNEKPPETLKIFKKAGGCCSRVADCLCCMCCIKACNRMNDQCAIVMTQICTALSCLGCYECCSEVCCGGSES